jgi:hypothetical protein
VRRIASGLLILLSVSACVPDGLAFRVDERINITEPADHATVTLPVRIAWEVNSFDIAKPDTPPRDDAGYFGVFVNRAAIPPGEAMPAKLEHGVYTTTDTSLLVKKLPPGTADQDQHTATIVLLDGAGRRIGETAFGVTFEVENS